MAKLKRSHSIHDIVLFLVTEVVSTHKQNKMPSPTIHQIANKIGYSEETILESLEFGKIEPVSLLQ
ncbi:hypothetical protein LGQ02_07785 [Bacillus shivajii]|uniref:hypothetical protein n=1 Tax=Bacillus shivajii TaxID=1983719 RepID=UPI001CFA1A19|nr:hypothetical protein [Bacillus shivajii]UCZ54641.1 hypothetical protein LGQ02_07785 [Bacillus shivajii]